MDQYKFAKTTILKPAHVHPNYMYIPSFLKSFNNSSIEIKKINKSVIIIEIWIAGHTYSIADLGVWCT